MKMMEILKLRIHCLTEAMPMTSDPAIATRLLVNLARAAQEYYTSGLYTQDAINEIRNAHSHPYTYDGTPTPQTGLNKILSKYNLEFSDRNELHRLAHALDQDIRNKTIGKDGSINYRDINWLKSNTLKTDSKYIYPHDGLAIVLAKQLAATRQK